MGMKLLSCAVMYSELWRMWDAFVIFFYEWAVGFDLYIILTCVGAKGSVSA